MEDGLQKQRKLLIGISLVIICLRAGAVKLTTISIAGNSVTVENPQGFYAIVWIVFAYLILRYYQFLGEYSARSSGLGIAKRFWQHLDRVSKPQLEDCLKGQIPCHLIEKHQPWHGPMVKFSSLKRTFSFVWSGDFMYAGEKGTHTPKETFHVNLLPFVPHILRSFLHVLFTSWELTNYPLPFVLAVLALIYGSFGPWEGSLLNVLRALF